MNNDLDASNQHPLYLPNGAVISVHGPVVVVGPNGSGKSRRSRDITSDRPIEVVNALRNTRISPQLQAVAVQQAKANYASQRDTARQQPYEQTNDFDFMLVALLGESIGPAISFLRSSRAGNSPELPPIGPLEKVQQLWSKFFPGRELVFDDYLPIVINTVAIGDEPQQYSAWSMSDGEKAALYLAGRTLTADHEAVILIDEPETHFHSLLAVQFWDAIEEARSDLRLIYVTHDMTFAASRKAAQYLLANPREGLTQIELASESQDLAALLLGTASLSFYATRVVFCEGEPESLDSRLYSAWFNSKSTIVRAVGSCEMVFRSVTALNDSRLINNLQVDGIVDRDFRTDAFFSALPSGVVALGVHEVETLFSLPAVVGAVAAYLSLPFDRQSYERQIVATYVANDKHKVILERWKLRVNASLTKLVSTVSSKNDSLNNLAAEVPDIFDQENWSFSPLAILTDEKDFIEGLFDDSTNIIALLKAMPGKQLRALPSSTLGISGKTYDNLVIKAISGEAEDQVVLTTALRDALKGVLPA